MIPGNQSDDQSPLRALLVTLATNWIGFARMPNALAKRGFDVSLIAPVGALVTFARPLARVLTFQTQISREIFWKTVGQQIDRLQPHVLIPGDDLTVRLLHELYRELPDG